MPDRTNQKRVVRESWIKRTNYGNIGRFETTGSPSLVGRGIAIVSENNENMRSAGSGIIVPSPSSDGSSNPRVLSDMGLAIPRPTRFPPDLAGLGDPRNSLLLSVSRISVALACGNGKLLGPLQCGCNSSCSAATALRLCSSII